MPILESYNSPSYGADARWGRGMEQFGFWYTDEVVKQWRSNTRFPQIITPETLAGAPLKAVALLRDISFLKQADALQVPEPFDRMSVLSEMGLGEVGEVHTEPADNGRTNDYIIPIESGGGGQVQIVVNPAWGVHWRLSSDHPLLEQFPQLGKTHAPDDSQPPASEKSQWGYAPYLAPEVLAQATHPAIIDVEKYAHDLRDLTADMLNSPNHQVKNGSWSLGLMQDSHTSALNIYLDAPHVHAGIALHLGHEIGLKRVCVYGFTSPETEGPEAAIARRAAELDKQWDSLHRYVYEQEAK